MEPENKPDANSQPEASPPAAPPTTPTETPAETTPSSEPITPVDTPVAPMEPSTPDPLTQETPMQQQSTVGATKSNPAAMWALIVVVLLIVAGLVYWLLTR